MTLLTIDPGTFESAYVIYQTLTKQILSSGKISNAALIEIISTSKVEHLVIEQIKSYGMPVGDSTITTCVWIGIFIKAWHDQAKWPLNDLNDLDQARCTLLPRKTIVGQICANARANDANIRAALIDLFGGKANAIGNKKQKGELYHVHKDVWSALAIAVAFSQIQDAEHKALEGMLT